MSEARLVTGVAAVLALCAVFSSVSPEIGAWLDWAMTWLLGVGVGGPFAWWAVRWATDEIGQAREFHRARPRQVPVEPVEALEQ